MTASNKITTNAAAELRPAYEYLNIRHLGLMDYETVWPAMQAFTDNRDEHTPDEIWLVEHPPVFTQGQAGKAEHILAAGDIPVVQVDRGGQVTYHGPGQIVAYTLIDLRRLELGVRALVAALEQAIINVLDSYGVSSDRLEGAPGIYVEGVKIASLGLRVRKGRSFHGLAFNVDMDLEPFQRINPCGLLNMQVTHLAAFTDKDIAKVETRLIECLADVLGYNGRLRQVAGQLP
jgi:lipoyl(octanoyl) transferase